MGRLNKNLKRFEENVRVLLQQHYSVNLLKRDCTIDIFEAMFLFIFGIGFIKQVLETASNVSLFV